MNDSQRALVEVLAFLDGTAPLEGVWFGEKHPTRVGPFWWRSLLTPAADQLLARLAAAELQLAEERRCMLLADKEQVAVWNYLQRVSPWLESNDMLWSDEIITGIDGLIQRAEAAELDAGRYRWLREAGHAEYSDGLPFICINSAGRFSLWNGEPADAAIDAALAATAGER